MNHFTQSLRFKVTLLVITVELLIFSAVGVFYIYQFNQEVYNAIIARLSIPALLMSRGELSLNAVSDKRTMEGLLREPYSEGIVIGLDGNVYFSSNPARLDTHLDEIDGLKLPDSESSSISVDTPDLITPVQDSTGTYLTCLSPLRPDGKLTSYLYLKVGTEISEAEKRKIAILFAIGSLGAIALTAAVLSWLLNLMVIRRLNDLVEIFRHFARGDYATRIQPLGGNDEIAALGQNFNAMMEAIQERENDLHRLTFLQHTILDNVTYGIISTTPDGTVTSFNSAAEHLLGYTVDEIVGKQTPECWHNPEEISQYALLLSEELGETVTPGFDVFVARLRRKLSEESEWTFIRKDGRRIPVNLSVTALRDENDRVIGFVGLVSDLTERKQAESERQTSLHYFESMDRVNRAIQGANDLEQMMRGVLDVVLATFDCDRAFLLYPCDPEAASWSVPMESSKPEYPGVLKLGIEVPTSNDVAQTFRSLLEADGPLKFGPGTEHPLPDDASERFGFKCLMSIAIRPRIGSPWQFGLHQCSNARNWTAEEERLFQEIGRRLADGLSTMLVYRDLQESEAKYRRIVDTATEGIWGFGPDTTTTFVNARLANMLCYSGEEMTGRVMTDFMFDEDLPDYRRRLESRRYGSQESYERRFRRKDGQTVWTLVSAVPVIDEQHRFQGSFGMFTDITERKLAEEALQKSETLLNATQQLAKVGGWEFDLKSGKSFWTKELYRIHEIPIDPSIDHIKENLACYKLEDRHILNEAFQRACEQGESYDLELPFTTYMGKPLWIRTTAQPVYEEGKVVRLVGNLIDITQRKRAEDALRVSSERLQLATCVANIGIWDWDIVNNQLIWDDSMYQLYGIRKEDFGGAYDAWIGTIHPEDKAHTDGEIQAALRGERKYAPEFRIVRPDGSIRYIKADSRTIRDQEGKPLRMIGINIDITESKRIQKAIRRSQSALEEAQRIAHIGSWDVDMVNDVLIWSDEIFRIWEIDKTQFEATFAAFLETVHPEDRDKVTLAYNQAIIDKCLYQVEHRLLFPDGRVKHIHERGEPYFDQDGHPVRFIGTSLDITERKLVEAELLRYKEQLEETVAQRTAELLLARDAAEAANKAKSIFLANMSHELRTPLNAILGFSSMMRNDPSLTEDLRGNVDIINRSGEHLLALINDVLEIAKIEAGRMPLEVAPFDLGGMVRDVRDMMQVRANNKGLQLLLDQNSEFPRYIKGDEAHLRQILVNLVGNSVKFTAQGGITIRLGTKNNARAHLLIEVEDSGPGISEEDLKRLFEPFVQLAEGVAHGGTGLGLSITRQFVQLMGGNIVVESRLGVGTLFRVDLPLELASAAEVVKLGNVHGEIIGIAPGQPAYRILIVEDQYENQLLLARLMSNLGLETKMAENGELGVQLFSEWHPDLIWMDRQMPVMDGVEATRRIRHLPDGDKVKIVAVTASVFKEQQPEMLQAGMDDLVHKPYQFNEIYDCLTRQLGVEYLYRTNTKEASELASLTPEMLAILPLALRNEFKETLKSLDVELIDAVIERIGIIDTELGKTLSCLADTFDFLAILNALDEVGRT